MITRTDLQRMALQARSNLPATTNYAEILKEIVQILPPQTVVSAVDVAWEGHKDVETYLQGTVLIQRLCWPPGEALIYCPALYGSWLEDVEFNGESGLFDATSANDSFVPSNAVFGSLIETYDDEEEE